MGLEIQNGTRDILVRFSDCSIKTAIFDAPWEKPKISIEGQELSLYSVLCPLTLKRREEFKFLMVKLTKLGIAYKWGFPFKLLVDFQRKLVVILLWDPVCQERQAKNVNKLI